MAVAHARPRPQLSLALSAGVIAVCLAAFALSDLAALEDYADAREAFDEADRRPGVEPRVQEPVERRRALAPEVAFGGRVQHRLRSGTPPNAVNLADHNGLGCEIRAYNILKAACVPAFLPADISLRGSAGGLCESAVFS